MLDWLRARNVALLDDVTIELSDGLNVVTGETGAGKTVLLDALGLVLGARGQARLVGPAGDRAVVEAGVSFPPDDPDFAEWFGSQGIEASDGDIVVRRELRQVSGAGSKIANRITVNGVATSVAALRRLGELSGEIYSQNEHLALLRADAARETLDRSAGLLGPSSIRSRTAARFVTLRKEEARLADLAGRIARADAERARMEQALREIDAARLAPGEEEALAAERSALGQAERLLESLDLAWGALSEREDSAASQAARAMRALGAAAEMDSELAGVLAGRPDLVAELEDLAEAVRDRRNAVRAAPERLARIEERFAVVRGLVRRHGAEEGGAARLLQMADEYRERLAALGGADEERERAEAAVSEADGKYLEAARELRARRTEEAELLAARVKAELADLGIRNARFEIRIEPVEPGRPAGDPDSRARYARHGLDRVEFWFSANPGMPPAPVSEVASGGETSRFFLALTAAGAGEGGGPSLVFDEADAGTSGRIAHAIGRRFARLAGSRQVVSVTHLPQVAALGAAHLRVEKLESDGSVRVITLSADERIEEIARMLAGPRITPSARRHARELLDSAGGRSGEPEAGEDVLPS